MDNGTHPDVVAMAFNLGSDARLVGASQAACPYRGHGQASLRDAWQAGWRHVDVNFGQASRERATIRLRLPRVAG